MRVRAAGLVIESNKVLVLRYNYAGKRIHALPGGNIEQGEFAPQTLVREFREELGLEISVGPLRFVGEMQAQKQIGQTLHLIFEVAILNGEPRLNPQETSAESVLWLDGDALSEAALYPDLNLSGWKGCEACDGAQYVGDVMHRVWA